MHAFMNRLQAAARMLIMVAGLCIAAAPAYAAEEEARVLILNALDPYGPGYLMIDAAMRASLAQETTRRIVLYSEQLDTQRFPEKALDPEILALLTKKYRNVHIDVVVTVSTPAFEFFQRHGDQLWPGARLVFHSLPHGTDPSTLPPNAIGQVNQHDFAGTLDLARRLQPNARRILVISGTAPLDLELEEEARQVVPTLAREAAVEFLSGWPLPELINRVSRESADTIVLHLTQFRDRDGRPYAFREVLREISSASAAPVYGLFETGIGFGDAAGSMEFLEDRGRLVAQLVRDAVAGRSPESGKALFIVPSRCVADAREMQRRSLDERRLPDGCDIRFTDRPLWRQYWWQIVVTLAIIGAQAMLIVALLAQRRRRRVAESNERKRYSEMALMNRRVALGEMSGAIAHELNQPLGAIRNNAGAAELLLKADPPKLAEVAEILGDIKRDDQRASDIIVRIRQLLRKSEFELRAIDLNEAIDESLKMLAAEALAHEVSLTAQLAPDLPKVSADRVQVEQVILNLARNAMEAMEGQSVDRKVLKIRSARANDKEAEVSVADSGVGIPPDSIGGIFDAFVTTKPNGMGLGLAISRTIIEAHGGQIHAENKSEGGAVIRFTLRFAPPSPA